MKLIQPLCRSRFDADDIAFILSVLGRKAGNADWLVRLLSDEESRDQILDDEALLKALLERGGCLKVSTRLYFYLLVRHTLRRSGIDDRVVADYLAEMMSEFALAERSQCVLPGQTEALNYFFEMLNALRETDDHTAFSIRLHVGNYSLFLSGMFPERIQSRAQSRGFPGLSYYRQLGQTQFRVASDHRLARRYDLVSVLGTLSERFETARIALNEIAERLLSLGDNSNSRELERLLKTSFPAQDRN
jgi:hypothetical protein